MASVIAWTDLQARLTAAGISSGGTVLPIAWPNQDFNAPAGTPAPWLMVQMVGGSGRPLELGGAVWQDEGQSYVHVLVPTKTGVAAAMDIVDQVVAAFRGPPQDAIIYYQVMADPGGAGSDDGVYWRTSVTAEWRAQTRVTGS